MPDPNIPAHLQGLTRQQRDVLRKELEYKFGADFARNPEARSAIQTMAQSREGLDSFLNEAQWGSLSTGGHGLAQIGVGGLGLLGLKIPPLLPVAAVAGAGYGIANIIEGQRREAQGLPGGFQTSMGAAETLLSPLGFYKKLASPIMRALGRGGGAAGQPTLQQLGVPTGKQAEGFGKLTGTAPIPGKYDPETFKQRFLAGLPTEAHAVDEAGSGQNLFNVDLNQAHQAAKDPGSYYNTAAGPRNRDPYLTLGGRQKTGQRAAEQRTLSATSPLTPAIPTEAENAARVLPILARGASDAIYSGVPRVRNFIQDVADTPQGQSIDDLLDEWLSDFAFTVPEQGLFTPRGLVQRVKGGVSDQAQGLQGTQQKINELRDTADGMSRELITARQAFDAKKIKDPTFEATKEAATLEEEMEKMEYAIELAKDRIKKAENLKLQSIQGIEQFLTGFSTDVNNLASIKALETGRPGKTSLRFVGQNLQSTSIPPGELQDWISEWLQDEAEHLLSF